VTTVMEEPLLREEPLEPMRCVAVIDQTLPIGNAANAAAVLALTMGKRQPQLAGAALVDASGDAHPGLIPIGIPVLGAPGDDLPAIRGKAVAAGLEVVDFPVQGQQTNDYGEFRRLVRETNPEGLRYLGVMIYGTRKKVSRVVGRYSLLRG
jgi:hypothetical protein